MKKLFLTSAVALCTLFASAQNFMVVTTYNAPEDGESFEMASLTDNMGIGYKLNDTWTVGLVTAGEDSLGDKSYDLWGRYNWNANMYVSVQAPTEEMMDNMTIGLGYSFNVWNGLNVEPNYSMGLKEDETTGEREGTFNLGLSYRF
jgi:opacity protein-like surface antigen